jgi:glycosyltransferase involved in cell wall biosynthesis
MFPKVSIVIPFYADPYVPHAIESALGQTYPNIEVVIVNDGSPTHTELLKPYLQHPKVVYKWKANGGTASALNAGIRAASGDYIAWLSSDDRFYPWKLARQLAWMIPRRALISFTDYDVIDENGQVTRQSAGHHFATYQEFCRTFLTGNPINGCTVLAHRKLLMDAGLFNERLPYTHDYDLWFRIVLAGVDFHYVPENLTQYRVHSAMGTQRHLPAILQETEATRSRWAPHMVAFIRRLG